ncbi:MAG: NAD-dependent epimerase/dehydratase family protein, partial [Candidatus Levybacteria bacterium]|nr:NAD-dependent epimerase/dehydratase family protein [Candidatus Levybacteria bacterium]
MIKSKIIQDDIRNIALEIKKDAKVLSGKTILITGGSGFLGKYFLHTIWYLNKNFLSKPCKVISLDNYITGAEGNPLSEDKNFIFIKHDVRKPFDIEDHVDYIIHAAGIASPVYYMKYPLETLEVATLGTKNMLEFARMNKVESFLFFSSSEIYGDPDPNFVPTPETYLGNVSCVGPRSCYDESKRLGETLCMIYNKIYKIPTKTVRPFNIYGPGMMPNDNRVVPRFLTSALKKESLPVHAGGNQTRTFCYISDAITGFFKVLLSQNNGDVFNVGNDDHEVNMMTLAQIVSKIFNKKVEIKSIEYPSFYPQGDPKRRSPDLTKIRT